MHQNGFSGAYIGFEVWWILWYWFEVSTIRGSCKIKMSGKKKCKMRYKSMKMELDLCSSAPWVPFYPYTTFQNAMSKSSCQKSRKPSITQKVLVTQCSNIVHCDWHIQNPICANFQGFSNSFSLLKFFAFKKLEISGPEYNLVPVLATRCLYHGGTSDWRWTWSKGWPNVKLTYDVPIGGPSDLSAKRTYENFNTLGVWGLASLRSFLRKTNNYIVRTNP